MSTGHARRRTRPRRGVRVGLAVTAAVLLTLCAGGAYVVQIAREHAVADLDAAVRSIGLGIERIDISGHRLTAERDILGALGLEPSATHLSFDPQAARGRIEQLAWVKSVSIQRALPAGLAVAITERQPFAVWQQETHDTLVDREGRELGAVRRGSDVGLPIVTGEGAGPLAAEILDLVAQHEVVRDGLVKAHRIAGRRWTLELAGGTLVHLPADAPAAALTRLAARHASAVTSGRYAVLDLRVAGQVVLRRAAIAAAHPRVAE